MGIYDRIKFVAFCPRCGCRLTDFQTKDESVCLIDRCPSTCKEEWRADCPECRLSIEFNHKRKEPLHPDGSAHIHVTYAK